MICKINITQNFIYYEQHFQINSDIEFVKQLLAVLNTTFPFDGITGKDWVLDANAAWIPDVISAFMDVIRPYKHRIYMLEQPWPVDFLMSSRGDTNASHGCDGNVNVNDPIATSNLSKWKEMKSICNRELDVYVFADESMCTFENIPLLLPYIDGVNVKLEKTGGYRGAVQAIDAVRVVLYGTV